MTNLSRSLTIGTSVLALAACGPESIGSPGAGNVDIVVEAPSPTPTPTSTTVPATIPAGACPTVTNDGSVTLTDAGTLGDGRGGSWRLCELPSVITKSVTLPKVSGLLYVLNGRTDVGCDGGFSVPTSGAPHATTTVGCPTANLTADTNVTLTIQPGVKIIGGTGQSWLAVNRGNKINAVGTATDPIIFTSRQNAAGINADSTPGGQWGGVVLMGRGQVTDCGTGLGTTPGVDCQRDTEGSVNPARFGGNDDTYNAGTMQYVQIRYSGFVLSNARELQALTTEAIGTGTTLSHIQSHRSSDDGAEFFGGKFDMKYYIASGADDDSLDVDTGARVNMQNVILVQVPGEGDAMMEIDSNGNEQFAPRTRLAISNLVGYQPQLSSANNELSGNARAALHLRGNSDTFLYNSAIIAPANECIRMTANAASAGDNATLTARSLVLQCAGSGDAKYIGDGTGATPFTAAAVRAFITGNSSNNESFVNTLTNGFVNGTAENGVTTTDPTALNVAPSTFFAATPAPFRIGAAWTENAAWYTGWTCSASYANFGTAPCTQLVG